MRSPSINKRNLYMSMSVAVFQVWVSVSQMKDTRLSSKCKKRIKKNNVSLLLQSSFHTHRLGKRRLQEPGKTQIRGVLFLFDCLFWVETSVQEPAQGALSSRPRGAAASAGWAERHHHLLQRARSSLQGTASLLHCVPLLVYPFYSSLFCVGVGVERRPWTWE